MSLFYRAYYRYLFGKQIPMADVIARIVRRTEMATGHRDVPASPDSWEAQYHRGNWDFLRELEQLPRYAIIADYVRSFRRGAAVLDVGCGEGLLQEKIGKEAYSRYLGVDVSGAAVARAAARADDRTELVAADAATYVPDGTFDVIIFNESLYYFEDPIAVLRRYAKFLAPGGVFVASLYEGSYRSIAVQRLLEGEYGELNQLWVRCGNKSSVVSIFSPRV